MDLSDCVRQIGEHTLHYSKCDEHLFSGYVFLVGHHGRLYVRIKRTKAAHRLVMGLQKGDGFEVDHINHNGLDNRRSNLRVCSKKQNQLNRRPDSGSTSEFKGVHWSKTRNKWYARIHLNGNDKHIGVFISEIDAARAYDRYAAEHFGEFAYLNFPQLQSAS